MSDCKKALIIGGGIGGLSAAIALHRKGISVEVVERSSDWAVYHVGIIVQANFIRGIEMRLLARLAWQTSGDRAQRRGPLPDHP